MTGDTEGGCDSEGGTAMTDDPTPRELAEKIRPEGVEEYSSDENKLEAFSEKWDGALGNLMDAVQEAIEPLRPRFRLPTHGTNLRQLSNRELVEYHHRLDREIAAHRRQRDRIERELARRGVRGFR